ncbi:hypothetical protein FA15DRAFT_667351 [Coprinopsis marcescibilis]|uniref:F-box domain-containing protein n=1 Tax=Coprinopsis marcescibilis TaxID=230819 RepID=A0A5C3L0I1_COPMA|nr:hypothetical protein FA15DRAFT_667351 [Coprinopsis marcescibilis]
MSKHELSPAPLPPAKRARALSGSASSSGVSRLLTFDNSIYDELVLCIFSHLSWVDLCAAQATSRNWARLASDNALWREQYLLVFGRTRLRGTRGFIPRSDGRETKPLPGRAKGQEYKDWKWMFRISSNWKNGRCLVENIPPPISPRPALHALEQSYQTHLLMAGPLTVVASSQPTTTPELVVTGFVDGRTCKIPCQSIDSGTYSESHITTLALDQSPPASGSTIRVAAVLSTGEIAVHAFNHSSPEDHTCFLRYKPSTNSPRTAPIVNAVYHHPLLITLSQTFTLSLYDLSYGAFRTTQSLTSFTSFPPTSLVLSTPTSTTYKLVVAYAIPVYPAHWSVGATELIISSRSIQQPQSTTTSAFGISPEARFSQNASMTVQSTRTIRSIDVPQGWIDERKLRAMREQWGRKVSQIADTQTDGKWVVLAPSDRVPYLAGYTTPHASPMPSTSTSAPSSTNRQPLELMKASPMQSETGLQLYRLTLPPQTNSISQSPPKLTFVRTLHGQSGPVSALALADGRCVSLAHNGSIWVWDLENGSGAEVAARDEPAIGIHSVPVKGSVVFDERRIISALAGKVVVRRFDI